MRNDRMHQIIKAEERDFKSGKFDYVPEKEEVQVGDMKLKRIHINKVYKGNGNED